MVYQEIQMLVAENESGRCYCRERFLHVEEYLAVGAVGIGECHVERRARDFTIGLIERGHVTTLLLECDSDQEPEFDRLADAARRSGWAPFQEMTLRKFVTEAAPAYPNDVEMGEVVTIALKNGVEVYFIDKAGPSKTHWKTNESRDKHAADRYDEAVVAKGAAGCLVLYGLLHFRGKNQRFYPNNRKCLGEILDLTYFTFD